MKYYLYILLTLDNTLYCGIAKDILKRFELHKTGKGAKYTKVHKPSKIVYADIFDDKSSALKEELRIKALKREQKLELIEKYSERTRKIILSSAKPEQCEKS